MRRGGGSESSLTETTNTATFGIVHAANSSLRDFFGLWPKGGNGFIC